MSDERVAVLFGRGITVERVERYLPSGYRVVDSDVVGGDGDSVIIAGTDQAGWTLDGYVLPRLASGGIYGSEGVPEPQPEPMDWVVVERRFREDFGDRWVYRPSAFRGLAPNFVTPEVLGFVRCADGRVAEVSTGITPVFGERPRREVRVYGVTFRPDTGSKLCDTWQEVREVVGS